jgi:hypothetical protein
MELAVVEHSGLVPIDPGAYLVVLGAAQAASGVLALVLRGRPRRVLLGLQALSLVALPLLVTAQEPLLWVHPFGPMIKNAPIVAGTALLAWSQELRSC